MRLPSEELPYERRLRKAGVFSLHLAEHDEETDQIIVLSNSTLKPSSHDRHSHTDTYSSGTKR